MGMKITIITLFPKMIEGFFEESIIKRAKEKGRVKIEIVDLRQFAIDAYGTVDDRPYGGGVGMILRIEPIKKAIQFAISKFQFPNSQKNQNLRSKTILTSARGEVYNQEKAAEYAKLDHLVIIAGHYEGVDERVLDLVDEEVSLGDFVLTGGEIPAAAIVDSVVRLIPGVLEKEEAVKKESYAEVSIIRIIEAVGENKILEKLKNEGVEKIKLLEYPQYTRPEEFEGKKVPSVLLSGNHRDIENWRIKKAFEETLKKRPDLLPKTCLQ